MEGKRKSELLERARALAQLGRRREDIRKDLIELNRTFRSALPMIDIENVLDRTLDSPTRSTS